MKVFRVVGPDGTAIEVEAPETATDAELVQLAQAKAGARPLPATTSEKWLASGVGRIAKGMKDPIDAGAQLLPRGLSAVTSGFGLMPNKVSQFFDSEAASIDAGIKSSEQDYQLARWKAGQSGFDGARLTGNIVNPATLALARVTPTGAATTLGRAFQGGVGGMLGGVAATPVTDASETSFGMQKLGQGVAGAAGGAIAAPVLGKAIDLVAPKIKALQAKVTDPMVLSARASMETDDALRRVFSEMQIDPQSVPRKVMEQLRKDVLASFKQGQRLDGAAALRKMDFDAQNVPALRGQITRDAGQYSQDMNLRGVQGVGEPIQNLLADQNQRITTGVAKFGGPRAAEKFQAGEQMTASLAKFDDDFSAAVSRAYKNARASSGKDWDVPLGGLSSDVQNIVDDFGVGGEKNAIPSAIYGRMKSLGIVGDGMTQRKVFNYEETDKLLKQINAHMKGGDNGSLGALHGAVKKAILEGGGDGDPFAPARKLAAERFQMLDAVPALKAVVDGKVPADDFVSRFIVGGKVKDLQKLVKIMPKDDMDEARRQIAKTIYSGAFRTNVTGDKAVQPAGFQAAMEKIGTDKLRVFFSQSEVEELQRLMRISAYANTEPAWGTVARGGNPGGVLFGQLARLGGAGAAAGQSLPLLGTGVNAGRQSLQVSAAMNPQVPKVPNLSPEEIANISGLLGISSVAAGGLLAPRP